MMKQMQERFGITFCCTAVRKNLPISLIQICFINTSSNAPTEPAFNILTLLLSDRRTKMQHQTTAMLMTIYINDNLWDEEERSEIIKAAVNIPPKKRRKTMDQEPK